MQLKVNHDNNDNGLGSDPNAVKRSLVSARNENPEASFGGNSFGGNSFGGDNLGGSGFGGNSFSGNRTQGGSDPFGTPDPFGPSTGRNPFENDELGPVSPKAPVSPVVYNPKKALNPAFIVAPIIIVVFLIVIIQTARGFKNSHYTPGVLSGNTYTNEYFGLKATFDSKYTLEGGYYNEDSVQNMLDAGQSVNELRASYEMSAEALNVQVYPLDHYYDAPTNGSQEEMEKYKDEYSAALTENGYTVSNIEVDSMTIAGKTVRGYLVDGKVGGTGYTLSLAQFFIYKGNFCCVISSASTSKGKAKLLISNNFSELD